jgi:SpoIID/LytB domain protein
VLTAGLTVLGATAPGPASAAVTVSEVYGRPASGVFVVQGHGWGHGHGLSQWGGQGAAKLGKTWRQITDFYYPSTSATTLANTGVRVQLRSNTDHAQTVVYAASGLYAYDVATKAKITLSSTPTRWRVTVDSAGYHLSGLSGSTWTKLAPTWTGPLQLQGPTFVRLAFPGGVSRDYRGAIRSVRTGTTTVDSLAVMPMESYLLGVVPRESPSSFAAAALQAQAVAARSYSAYQRAHAGSRSYDLCDTTACQVFYGSHGYDSAGNVTNYEATSTNQAVQATAGVVRSDANGPIFAEFSSSNGGWSTNGGYPYLIAQRDDWDGAVANPVHSWTAKLPVSALESRYGMPAGSFRRLTVTQRDGNGEWGGRVLGVTLTFVDSAGTTTNVDTTGRGIYNARSGPRPYSDGLLSSWWYVVPEYSATLLSASAAPTLVLPPGTTTGSVTATVKNTGSGTWPTAGLHLALASPAGGADPLAHGSTTPGTFTGNLTSPGSSSVLPGEVATFRVDLDAAGQKPGTRTAAYRLQIGRASLFGPVLSWSVPVQAARLTAAQSDAPALVSTTLPAQEGAPAALFADHRTVVVPRSGSTTVRLTVADTGNVTWPVGSGTPVHLGTSDPRGRSSASAGPSWLSASRPTAVAAPAAVAPGQSGSFDVQLYGAGKPVGVTTEAFEPVWEGRSWLAGNHTSLVVVRVDPGVPDAAVADRLPASGFTLVNAPNGTATLVVRLRNVGGRAWVVGTDQLGTAASAPLQKGWPSATRTPALSSNITRPGQAKVYPGEVGQWLVPVSAYRKAAGSYTMTLRAVGAHGLYGPMLRVSTKVVAASFAASKYAVSSSVRVPSHGTTRAVLYVKNTGNVDWPVGGAVRSRILGSSSPSKARPWITAQRPGSLSSNLSRRGATTVRPGEVARFELVLAGNGRSPRSTSERFGIVWETWRAPSLAVTLAYRVV